MTERIYVVGHGTLSDGLVQSLPGVGRELGHRLHAVQGWDEFRSGSTSQTDGAMVVHAGSGRQLADVLEFCQAGGVPLLQASTGIENILGVNHQANGVIFIQIIL